MQELEREGNCRCYVVATLRPTVAVVFVVPHGCEGRPCANPWLNMLDKVRRPPLLSSV